MEKVSVRATQENRKTIALGIGDDAALLHHRKNQQTILTCDWFLEGTHFLRDKHPADSVGWKCLARAMSDIAAMGGRPTCFLLSLALPEELTGTWLSLFLGGLKRASHRFGCPLVGGDTTKRKEVLINVTIVGEIQEGKALQRSGANAGDIIFVSGKLGEAEEGLRLVQSSKNKIAVKDVRLRKHLYPEPRLALGQWLVQSGLASAAMDLSDGLSTDLPRLCRASAVGAIVDLARLPMDLSASKKRAVSFALHGGDDYELLFTVPKHKTKRLPPKFKGLTLTAIGEITRSKRIFVRAFGGALEVLRPGGWDPFRS